MADDTTPDGADTATRFGNMIGNGILTGVDGVESAGNIGKATMNVVGPAWNAIPLSNTTKALATGLVVMNRKKAYGFVPGTATRRRKLTERANFKAAQANARTALIDEQAAKLRLDQLKNPAPTMHAPATAAETPVAKTTAATVEPGLNGRIEPTFASEPTVHAPVSRGGISASHLPELERIQANAKTPFGSLTAAPRDSWLPGSRALIATDTVGMDVGRATNYAKGATRAGGAVLAIAGAGLTAYQVKKDLDAGDTRAAKIDGVAGFAGTAGGLVGGFVGSVLGPAGAVGGGVGGSLLAEHIARDTMERAMPNYTRDDVEKAKKFGKDLTGKSPAEFDALAKAQPALKGFAGAYRNFDQQEQSINHTSWFAADGNEYAYQNLGDAERTMVNAYREATGEHPAAPAAAEHATPAPAEPATHGRFGVSPGAGGGRYHGDAAPAAPAAPVAATVAIPVIAASAKPVKHRPHAAPANLTAKRAQLKHKTKHHAKPKHPQAQQPHAARASLRGQQAADASAWTAQAQPAAHYGASGPSNPLEALAEIPGKIIGGVVGTAAGLVEGVAKGVGGVLSGQTPGIGGRITIGGSGYAGGGSFTNQRMTFKPHGF